MHDENTKFIRKTKYCNKEQFLGIGDSMVCVLRLRNDFQGTLPNKCKRTAWNTC